MAKHKALEEVQLLIDRIAELESENADLSDELNAANVEINELIGGLGLQEAANAVVAEIERPVGDINAMTLRDAPAVRRALRALSDAAGKAI